MAFCPRVEACDLVTHIDGNTFNNHWSNLKWTNKSGVGKTRMRAERRQMLPTNTSGVKGVSYHKTNKSWIAMINNNEGKAVSKTFTLSIFPDAKEKAIEWRKAKEKEFGYF